MIWAVGDGNPIPRISYRDAMELTVRDKPDLRFGMELIELTDVFSETEFGVLKMLNALRLFGVKNGASLSRKQIDNFTNIAKSEGAGGLAYITYQDGEAKSPIAKFLSEKELADIQQKTGAIDGDAVFFGADSRSVVNAVLGRLRNELPSHFNLKDPSVVAFAWIIIFRFMNGMSEVKNLILDIIRSVCQRVVCKLWSLLKLTPKNYPLSLTNLTW